MLKSIARRILCLVLTAAILAGSPCPAYSLSSKDQNKTAIKKGLSYLAACQNSDGGFPAKKGEESSVVMTQWAVMALRAAGENITGSRWTRGGNNPLDYLKNATDSLHATTDYARTLLCLRAAEMGDTLQGLNLADKIISFQQPNGQFAQSNQGESDLLNAHVWSVIALAAAEREIPQVGKAKKWLLEAQNSDGGFSWYKGGESDPDDTAIALNALLFLGEDPHSSPAINRALRYLRAQVGQDGGVSWSGHKSNAASDAWCIQGLLAAGVDPASPDWQVNGNSPVSHLLGLQRSDGSFQWMEGVGSTPVLMTSYAIIALAGNPFPVNIDYSQKQKRTVKIVLTIDSREVQVNEEKTMLDVSPGIINNRAMVPLRFIGESLGAEVVWLAEKQTILIRQDGKELSLVIGELSADLDTPAITENGRTLVPLRYVSESLGARVNWNGAKRVVEIIRE